MRRGLKIAIALLVGLVAALVVNALIVNGKTAEAEIDVSGARLVDTPAGELQVAESGSPDGPPLVLLHCYTCAMSWWEPILPLLERRHRVIRIDLLGHGGSEKPGSGYSMEDQATAVAAALRELDVDRATVVGHSLGFSVAVALAEQHPELVSGLVNIDEWSTTDQGELPFPAQLAYTPLIGQAISQVVPDAMVRDGLEVAFAPDYELSDDFGDQIVDDFRELTYTAYSEIDEEARAFLDESPNNDRLTRIRKPLLVIFGTEDQLYDSPEAVADSYRQVPGAKVVMLPGAGHSANVEQPRRTAALILPFARSN